jgi:3-deoxy-D-manno-octulosonic-acid transferase
MYLLYNILLFIAAVIITPYYLLKIIFTGKYRKSFIQKLGGRQAKILADLKDRPRVWIHAVSVGEVTAAAPIAACLKKKRPEAQIVFPPLRKPVRKWRGNLSRLPTRLFISLWIFPPLSARSSRWPLPMFLCWWKPNSGLISCVSAKNAG